MKTGISELLKNLAKETTTDKLLGYTDIDLMYSAMIFFGALLEKSYEKCLFENINHNDKCEIAEKCGYDLRQLILKYTNKDTHELIKQVDFFNNKD